MSNLKLACLALTTTALACGTTSPSAPLGGSLSISGNVVDLETGAAVTGNATVSTSALSPAPKITVQGAAFTIDEIPANSTFQLLASVPPTHHATYSPATVVVDADLTNLKAYVVSETFLSRLATGFSVTPSAAKGVLLLHLVDAMGTAKANVAGSNLVLAGATGASGPHFLDANLAPSTATVSSSSGWVVFFEVPSGAVSLGSAVNATATLQMATSPVGASIVTIANVVVADGAPPALPTNVSFSTDVFPIFQNRGCAACHSGNGAGRDLGNLTLDGSTNLVYKELVTETTTRVVVAAPETSRVLTMPSYENPPDGHPNVTFTGPQDKDYLKILVWIREGAKQN
ncbi:MAG: hypothetical protein JWO36_3284 [Myxococcales bacterium]|nr:hypothetical protein [Myxococcales bacterium]